MQNFYCDHINFDSVNQFQQTKQKQETNMRGMILK
jgi:hypothetical protein